MDEEVIYGQLKLTVGGGRCKERLELADQELEQEDVKEG